MHLVVHCTRKGMGSNKVLVMMEATVKIKEITVKLGLLKFMEMALSQ